MFKGYDAEGRPIWIAEVGKMDLRAVLEEGGDDVNYLEKYAKQAAYRIMKSILDANTEDRVVTEVVGLLDADGVSLKQVTYVPNAAFLMKIGLPYRQLAENHVGGGIVVNGKTILKFSTLSSKFSKHHKK